ncbi:hypothetical protein DMUE_3597 [Dictyocoela muelleri]|nr:hypothetical protein DMUE_3597 [Dictyocoela muelleri]
MNMKKFGNLNFLPNLIIFLKNCFSSDINLNDDGMKVIPNNRTAEQEYIQNPNTNDRNIVKSPDQEHKSEDNKHEIIRNYFDNIKCPVMNFLVVENIITEERVYNLISGAEKFDDIPELKIDINSLTPNDLLAIFGYKFIPDMCKKRWSYKNQQKIYGFSKIAEKTQIADLLNFNDSKHVYITSKISYSHLRQPTKISGNNDEYDQFLKNFKDKIVIISQDEIDIYDLNVLYQLSNDLCKIGMYPKKGIIITITHDDEEGIKIRSMLDLKNSTFIHEPSVQVTDENFYENIICINGLYVDEIVEKTKSYFYDSELLIVSKFKYFFIHYTVIDIILELSIDHDKILKIVMTVKNKISGKRYKLEFDFIDCKIRQIKYNSRKMILQNKIVEKIFCVIEELNTDPFSDIKYIPDTQTGFVLLHNN